MARVKDLWHDRDRNRTKRFGIGRRWQAVWQEGGREYTKTFNSKDAAEAHLTRISHDMRAGDYVSERENVTMADYWPMFEIIKSDHNPATIKMYRSIWRSRVAPQWGDVPLKTIKKAEVQLWLKQLSREGKKLSVSRKSKILILAKALAQLAIEDEKLKNNPFDGISAGVPKAKEKRFLTVRQADALLDGAGEHRLEVSVMLTLGLRRGEMAGLKTTDLDAGRRRLVIQRAIDDDGNIVSPKNKKSREVPVTPEILHELEQRAKVKKRGDWFFLSHLGRPWTNDSWRVVWDKIAPYSGVDGLQTHELRHTAVSWAIAAGANVKMIQLMVGHASAAMTLDIYGHLWNDELDTVMDKVGAFIVNERGAAMQGLGRNTDGTSIVKPL